TRPCWRPGARWSSRSCASGCGPSSAGTTRPTPDPRRPAAGARWPTAAGRAATGWTGPAGGGAGCPSTPPADRRPAPPPGRCHHRLLGSGRGEQLGPGGCRVAIAAVADTSTDEQAPPGARRPAPFVRWGLATYLVVTAIVLAGIVWRLGGAFAYV